MNSFWHTAPRAVTTGRAALDLEACSQRDSEPLVVDCGRGATYPSSHRALADAQASTKRADRPIARRSAPTHPATHGQRAPRTGLAAQGYHSTKSDQGVGRVQVHVNSKGQASDGQHSKAQSASLGSRISVPAIVGNAGDVRFFNARPTRTRPKSAITPTSTSNCILRIARSEHRAASSASSNRAPGEYGRYSRGSAHVFNGGAADQRRAFATNVPVQQRLQNGEPELMD